MARWRVWLILLGALWLLPAQAQDQAVAWQEQTTTYMSILYPAGYEADAARYASFVDAIYEEVTAAIGYRPDPPLTLRIYPTLEIYQQVNPLARVIAGVIAHAHTGRREISIALPYTQGHSEDDIRNTVRHELMHIIAAELSSGRLSTMWQEGIAQYVEQPSPQVTVKHDLLAQAYASDRLLPWGRLDSNNTMYNNPEVGYPQSWSMVSFLIQQYGMPAFVEFVRAMANASGYRSALESVYDKSADTLEVEWLDQLPSWISNDWQAQPVSSVDLDAIRAALDAGRYAEAEQQARAALATAPAEQQAQLETLQQIAQKGVRAESAFNSARTALLRGDYASAESSLSTARTLYAQLERADVLDTLDIYAAHIADGQRGYTLLSSAKQQVRSLRWSAARSNINQAAALFASLGDAQGQAQAQALLNDLNRRSQLAGLVLLALVLLGLAWNIDRRRAARQRSQPYL